MYAQEILEIRGAVTPENRDAGARCLTLTRGKEYIYDTVATKFSTLEEAAKNLEFQREIDKKAEEERKESERRLAEAERAAKEAEERAESAKLAAAESAKLAAEARRREDAKRLEVWTEVFDACKVVYFDEPTQALTNRVCLDVFLETGLPKEE